MTTSTIAQVVDKLATLQAAITGVTSAFGHNKAPDVLRPAMLPAFVNVWGPAEANPSTFGGGMVIDDRVYRMILYVCPLAQPSDVAKQANLVEPFHDLVLAKFKGDIELSGLTVTGALYVGDDGLDVLDYAGNLYAGIEFRIRVMRQL